MLCTKRYRIVAAAGGVDKQTRGGQRRSRVLKVGKERTGKLPRKRSDAVDEIVRWLGAKGQPPNVFVKSPAVDSSIPCDLRARAAPPSVPPAGALEQPALEPARNTTRLGPSPSAQQRLSSAHRSPSTPRCPTGPVSLRFALPAHRTAPCRPR